MTLKYTHNIHVTYRMAPWCKLHVIRRARREAALQVQCSGRHAPRSLFLAPRSLFLVSLVHVHTSHRERGSGHFCAGKTDSD